jgi:hypothetical protein
VTTAGKVVLGMMGRLRPKPAAGDSPSTIALPQVDRHGGMPLMEALSARRSSREFAPDPLPLPLLAGVLWAAYGINRPEGGRTAPTAINAQEIDVFARCQQAGTCTMRPRAPSRWWPRQTCGE